MGQVRTVSGQFWWNVSRSAGIVAWALSSATIVWGILLATRVVKPGPRPAWYLDLHKWLGLLTIVFTGMHMAALVADSYITFTVVDILVPFASSWRPLPVALGIVSLYGLVAVQGTSYAMKKMSKTAWRRVHMSSYAVFVTVTLHAVLAGSDAGKRLFTAFSTALVMVTAAVVSLRLVVGRKGAQRRNGEDNART